MKKVLVSGCFDLLHAGHIAFLEEASSYGDLHVCAGSDANIGQLKGHQPMFSEQERVYVLNSLACVKEARVSSGRGMLDFEADIAELKPDVFVVNADGHREEKKELCEKLGVEYHVLERVPAHDFPPRSSTDAKKRLEMPFRVCLAGGWMDQPWVSEIAPGSVVVARLHPTMTFMDRAGMATSTRRAAQKFWSGRFPDRGDEEIAKLLFGAENPPGTKYISGSQDALGLSLPGINRLDYNGGFWPENIESTEDPETVTWLESVLKFIPVRPRPDGYDPLVEKNLTEAGVKRLGEAGRLAWESIVQKDAAGLGHALNETTTGWRDILPYTVDEELMAHREKYADKHGSCYSGCGGGYLMVISEDEIPDALNLSIATRHTNF